jgi:hypothetical protein
VGDLWLRLLPLLLLAAAWTLIIFDPSLLLN